MKKIISILTATRAEYGLLKPIIKKLNMIEEFDIKIVATGMHLSHEFGMTYQEIEQDGFTIHKKIEILRDGDTSTGISKAMGHAMFGFSEYFEDLKPDLLIVLGDRYETLAVCCAAMNARIPIAHLYGGETTEGAIDEAIRHAITKMSYLHFTSTAEYRKRVIQLGESPDRVFQVGAIGIENILNVDLLSKAELAKSININLEKPYAVITFHPSTLEEESVMKQFNELLKACNEHKELNYIFTKANADANGRIINKLIDKYAYENENVTSFTSLGMLRYLSTLKYCKMVIGNSSSGLIEAPSFGIPTINIGDRQKGRLCSDSVIHCTADEHVITKSIDLALSNEFQEKAKRTNNPYGDGKTSDKIVEVLKYYMIIDKINLKKQFYNINFEVN
jgi:GDP/UDP-N,N'-diacetylbacillosamine 2-epimerase (hydrolysing)